MPPLAQAAVAPRLQPGKGGSPNDDTGPGSHNTGSTGRLAPLSAVPVPPPPPAFTADSASAGTPTSLLLAAPAQKQQAAGGAAARCNKRHAPQQPVPVPQQVAAWDSDDGQGSHGSGTAGGAHQCHLQLLLPASATAKAGPGGLAHSNEFGAAGLPGVATAGSSPAGPAALPLDLSGLEDLDVPGLDDLLLGINAEEDQEALLGDPFTAQLPALAAPWAASDPFAQAPAVHQPQLPPHALQHPVGAASAVLAPSAGQQWGQPSGPLLLSSASLAATRQMPSHIALQQQQQRPVLVPQPAALQHAVHAVPLSMDRSSSADTRRSHSSLNLLPGTAARKPAAAAGRQGSAGGGRRVAKRAAAAAATSVPRPPARLAATRPVLALHQDQQPAQQQAMQAVHTQQQQAQQQQAQQQQAQQQQLALQVALRQRVQQAQQCLAQQQQLRAAVPADSRGSRGPHFMPPAMPAAASLAASRSGVAQLLAQQQQKEQEAPLPTAPERPATRWLAYDPSALRPVKRAALSLPKRPELDVAALQLSAAAALVAQGAPATLAALDARPVAGAEQPLLRCLFGAHYLW